RTACGHDFLDGLNQREQLAQLIMVGVKNTEDAKRVVNREQIGGIFIGSWTDMSILDDISQIKEAAEHRLMVAIDEEGGRVSRLDERFGPMPSARQSARNMSASEVRAMARKRGRQMADLGITVDFAPDADVSAQAPGGPIGDRSYSSDPKVVATYATAFARGLQDAGVLPVIKHFPGHGRATGDSHTGLVTTPPLQQLLEHDLVPFRQMVEMN